MEEFRHRAPRNPGLRETRGKATALLFNSLGCVAEGESAYRSGRFSPYKKYPNTITTCLPGIRPAVRSRFDHEVIVGVLQPDFILGIEVEFDKRPRGGFRPLYGKDAPDLRNLLRLLLKESEMGGPCGTLYADC